MQILCSTLFAYSVYSTDGFHKRIETPAKTMQENHQVLEQISAVLEKIASHHQRFEIVIEELRTQKDRIDSNLADEDIRSSTTYWKSIAFFNSAIRVRLLLENNFFHVETLGLLAVSRYLLELSIWLELMRKDATYALDYLMEMTKISKLHRDDARKMMQLEVRLFRDVQKREDARIVELATASDSPRRTGRVKEDMSLLQAEIDKIAARIFSEHFPEAQVNGFGYQAEILETHVLPYVSHEIEQIDREAQLIERALPKYVRNRTKQRWNWKAKANEVGLQDEYEYIYTYCSRLLHATPFSVTTDQKNLEYREVLTFLRYAEYRISAILDYSRIQADATCTVH